MEYLKRSTYTQCTYTHNCFKDSDDVCKTCSHYVLRYKRAEPLVPYQESIGDKLSNIGAWLFSLVICIVSILASIKLLQLFARLVVPLWLAFWRW